MKISTVNYLSIGASKDAASETMYAFNIGKQTDPYIGEPFKLNDLGKTGFNLGVSRSVSCVACCGVDIQGISPPSTIVQLTWRLRNGGEFGTIVASGDFLIEHGFSTFFNTFGHDVQFIDEVTADWFEINQANSYEHVTVNRLWIGNTILLEYESGVQHLFVNESIVETNKTGEDFVLNKRLKREINSQSIEVFDNLYDGETAEIGDMESVFNSLIKVATQQEIVVDSRVAPLEETPYYAPFCFHGRLVTPVTLTKLAANRYMLNLTVREF